MGYKSRVSRTEVCEIMNPDPAKREEMNAYFPRNCPVRERTGDGVPVGRCWYHLGKDGNTCPRHGDVSKETWMAFKL